MHSVDRKIDLGYANSVSGMDTIDDGYADLSWPRGRIARGILEELDLACVYGIGPVPGSQIRIGTTSDLGRTLSLMKIDAWKPLRLHHHVFVTGTDLPRRLKSLVCSVLTRGGRHLRGDWYDISTDLLRSSFHVVARGNGIPVLSHEEMMARVATIRRHRLERAVHN